MSEFITVRIPRSLYEKIQELKKRYSIQEDWQLILEAISLYESFKSNRKLHREIVKQIPRLDKASWYSYKFAKSVALFLENPSDENFTQLLKRITELSDRIFGSKVPLLQELEQLVISYKNNPSVRLKIEINDVSKLIISEIIVKMLFEEEKK